MVKITHFKPKLRISFVTLSKRQKFIFVSLLLALGLFSMRFFNLVSRFRLVGILAVCAYLFSVWALREGFNRLSWLTTLLLPAMFAGGAGLFYLLVPDQLPVQVGVALGFALGFYSLLLTENIFSAAAIRTIQLFRSAQTVGFLITIITAFFFYNTILSFKLDPWYNLLVCALVSIPLVFQSLWSMQLKDRLSLDDLVLSLIYSFVLGQIAFAFSFWPVSVSTGSLGIAATLYIILNLTHHDLAQRLFIKVIRENVFIAAAVLLAILIATSWTG